jgi:hypothetical protein
MIKLEEGKLAIQGRDPANGYVIQARMSSLGNRPGDFPVQMSLSATDAQGRDLAEADTAFGSDYLKLVVPAPPQGGYSTAAICMPVDRRPDADGRRYISGQAPPAPRPEAVQPRPGFQWVAGHWQLHHARWDWQSGHWERQRAGRVYEPGMWTLCDGRYLWADDRWVQF